MSSYYLFCFLTSEVLQNSGHVDWGTHTDPVLGQTLLDVAQHSPHGEDDSGLRRPGHLGDLLFPSSAGHGVATRVRFCFYRTDSCLFGHHRVVVRSILIKTQSHKGLENTVLENWVLFYNTSSHTTRI